MPHGVARCRLGGRRPAGEPRIRGSVRLPPSQLGGHRRVAPGTQAATQSLPRDLARTLRRHGPPMTLPGGPAAHPFGICPARAPLRPAAASVLPGSALGPPRPSYSRDPAAKRPARGPRPTLPRGGPCPAGTRLPRDPPGTPHDPCLAQPAPGPRPTLPPGGPAARPPGPCPAGTRLPRPRRETPCLARPVRPTWQPPRRGRPTKRRARGPGLGRLRRCPVVAPPGPCSARARPGGLVPWASSVRCPRFRLPKPQQVHAPQPRAPAARNSRAGPGPPHDLLNAPPRGALPRGHP